VDREIEPTELFPADLDLVVRLDVGRMRGGIGPEAAHALAKRAFAGGAEGEEIHEALACADVVWIATRLMDAEAGDRVVAVEGKSCMPSLVAARWARVRSGNKRVRIFDRTSEAPRPGFARIVNLGDRATVFVSPVELDAVKRVMDDGPDAKRGAPAAEGILSFDQRAGRLPRSLEKKYPSIGAVLAGVERVRGSAVLVDEGLKVEAQVVGVGVPGAERAAKFLEALRDTLAKSARFAGIAKEARVEQVEKTVHVRLTVPGKLLLALLTEE
jgi:hypothetical protein